MKIVVTGATGHLIGKQTPLKETVKQALQH
ncbi:hypothetical protein J2S00_002553 [Caldalkalibacillus uzonensis]|uniref:Uncharacterized protein n=1 Tax=Caldalkalibacillus uzonensis TaxID=353224 RepID=A0ABU0CTK9_9BACI|nr:hypothetical protein [Caldalkalibacillus uzonensis]